MLHKSLVPVVSLLALRPSISAHPSRKNPKSKIQNPKSTRLRWPNRQRRVVQNHDDEGSTPSRSTLLDRSSKGERQAEALRVMVRFHPVQPTAAWPTWQGTSFQPWHMWVRILPPSPEEDDVDQLAKAPGFHPGDAGSSPAVVSWPSAQRAFYGGRSSTVEHPAVHRGVRVRFPSVTHRKAKSTLRCSLTRPEHMAWDHGDVGSIPASATS